MKALHACRECLRRSWLLSLVGPYLEQVATASDWRRSADFLQLTDEALVELVAPDRKVDLLRRVESMGEDFFAEKLGEARCWAICRHDDRYPSGLAGTPGAPRALIGRGEAASVTRPAPAAAVTIVGSRRARPNGRRVARDLARDLAGAGTVVVSGLAFGIDACAHRGALDAGGPTIAVLGCGPDIAYPAAHRALWGRIAETGAVISELPTGATPWRWTLVCRKLFGPIRVDGGGPYRQAADVSDG